MNNEYWKRSETTFSKFQYDSFYSLLFLSSALFFVSLANYHIITSPNLKSMNPVLIHLPVQRPF